MYFWWHEVEVLQLKRNCSVVSRRDEVKPNTMALASCAEYDWCENSS